MTVLLRHLLLITALLSGPLQASGSNWIDGLSLSFGRDSNDNETSLIRGGHVCEIFLFCSRLSKATFGRKKYEINILVQGHWKFSREALRCHWKISSIKR